MSVARAALTNGAERAVYLKLAPSEERAVVEVLIQAEPALEEYCSGVLVANGVVLTAKHCAHGLDAAQVTVLFSPTDDENGLQTGATVVGVHAELDLMALTINDEIQQRVSVTPLSIGSGTPTGLRPGSLVQTAGYGFDTDSVRGSRAFLVETVRKVDEHEIAVDAASLGGACFGDSGGPLLLRDDQGIPRTLGILAFGSNDCFGRDHYTRVGDGVAEWIQEITGVDPRTPAVPRATGEVLGLEGRCFGEQAIWSEAETIESSFCVPPQACGWSDHDQGFRCVEAKLDPCQGVGDLGTCDDGTATRCVQGRLEKNPCSACGFVCVRSPRSGSPICLSNQSP